MENNLTSVGGRKNGPLGKECKKCALHLSNYKDPQHSRQQLEILKGELTLRTVPRCVDGRAGEACPLGEKLALLKLSLAGT